MARKLLKKLTIEGLANLLEANPGCAVVLDNDYWWINREPAEDNPHDDEEEADAWSKWEDENTLCTSDDMQYSSGPYGRDILEALALLNDITIENC